MCHQHDLANFLPSHSCSTSLSESRSRMYAEVRFGWLGPARMLHICSCVIAFGVMVVGLTMAPEGHAQSFNAFLTGNDAYSWCQKDRLFAQGYAAGLWDEAVHGSVVLGRAAFGEFCGPNNVTLDQVTDVFCNYLRDVPADRHKPAVLLFHTAMKKVWPCTN